MKLYAQQGYGIGDRIAEGLRNQLIDGAILSPKDCRLDRIKQELAMMADEFPDADRLFDPQYYAAIIPLEDANLGHLAGEDYPYLQWRRRANLESEQAIIADLKACLDEQRKLAVTAIIAPNITISKSLNSIEAVIAKNFIRHSASVYSETGDTRPLYATLAVDAEALQDRHELMSFLTDITLLDTPPDGFYLLINHTTPEVPPELVDYRTLAGAMLINHSLELNGFNVINGYSDMLSPFLAAAGASAAATGWWSNLKVFSLSRFQISTGGGRRPVQRYLSKALLNSIRFDELDRIKERFPDVLNQLPSDVYYNRVDSGSQPDSQVEEVMQTWDTLRSFWAASSPTPSDCLQWIEQAGHLYRQLKASPGIILPARSNDNHLESLEDGVKLFAELGEIQL